MLHRRLACAVLLLAPAAACTDDSVTTKDAPRLIAAAGPHVVVAASSETEQPSLGCGGGGDPRLGPSVLFVSDDSGGHYDRIIPDDPQPLTRIGVKDGVFYGVAQQDTGFTVVRSTDGRSWTQVAVQYEGEPHDLFIGAAGLAVASTTGVMTSADGTTWTSAKVPGALYAPSIARLGDQLVVGTAADGVLNIQQGGAWTKRTIPNMTSIWELVPHAGGLIVTGMARFDADPNSPAVDTIARIDLASDAAPSFGQGSTTHPIVTPLGLLDNSGALAPFDGTSVGALAPFVAPFESATVDGDRVTVLRSGKVSLSTDGGRTFAAPVELPIQSIAR